MRYAIVTGSKTKVENYLPDNYSALIEREVPGVGAVTLVGGCDAMGWTLNDYVLPRLASGLYWGREVSVTGAVNFQNGTEVESCV